MNGTNDTFVLDANVLINANNTYYAPNLCAEFWKYLIDYREKAVFSIDKVYDELVCHSDPCMVKRKQTHVCIYTQ